MIALSVRNPRSRRASTAAVICLAGSFILVEALSPWHAQITARDPGPRVDQERTVRSDVRGDLAAIAERPLFAPSRRPWTPLVHPVVPTLSPRVVPPPALPNGYVLKGIAVSSQGRSALVWSQPRHCNIRLVQGQMLDGWALVAIDMDGLSLRQGERTFRLSFPGTSVPQTGLAQTGLPGQPQQQAGNSSR